MSFEAELRRLLGMDDELSKLKLDILRVLAIFNGVSWMSEIIPDIMKIYGYSLDHPPREELLAKALEDLEAKGLISIESRKRGMPLSREVYEDKLIKLKDLESAKRVLSRDKIYREYLSWRMEAIWRAAKDLKR